MEAASTLSRPAPREHLRGIDWNALSVWLLGFGLIAYLGLKGGGYDPLVHDQVGIAVWWILFAGMLIGALPRGRAGTLAWCALGLLAAFTVWTAISLGWTESTEKTAADLARIATYLGVFALALFACRPRDAGRLVAAVGSGIAFVAVIALLSRLHPAWFPAGDQTARFLADSQERLSYPLNYWNGLAALVAVGLPLMLQVATGARSVATRALAAATLPAMALTIFFTLSRGGIAAAIVALALFVAFASDRLPKLLTLGVAAGGGAILIGGAVQRDDLRHGLLTTTAHHQGSEMLAMTIVVCAGVGLLQAGISLALLRGMRPRWASVSRRHSAIAALTALVAIVIAAAALNAPDRASNAWSQFKQTSQPGGGIGRLGSFSGESRYQLWSEAVKENRTRPLTGTGSGTFQYWWARNGTTGEAVIDTHSLYLQTLGELGIVGLLLLSAFLLAILLGGGRNVVRAEPGRRSLLAAALAGCVAFCFTAAFDWMWQIPVLPVALLLLASILITSGSGSGRERAPGFRLPARIAIAAIAIAAIAAIAIPLSSETLVRQSQADARAGNAAAALAAARSAQNAEPGAASPRLQQALVLETAGELRAAAV
ncbi:MAG TPA: O-antigen ligase family protein, partial [Solirubrobacterales bacterium]